MGKLSWPIPAGKEGGKAKPLKKPKVCARNSLGCPPEVARLEAAYGCVSATHRMQQPYEHAYPRPAGGQGLRRGR